MSAALGWRLLVVAAALSVIGLVVGYLAPVVIPVAIALLLAALLAPAVGYLVRRKVPRWLAAVLVLVGGLAVLGGLLTFVIITFVNGLPALQVQLSRSIDAIANWLTTGPLHLSDEQVRTYFDNLVTTLTNTQTGITSEALTTAATIGEVLAQMLLILFVLIFLLYDGRGIWAFLLRATPHRIRIRVDVAGRRSLAALVSYVRATITVATVDAVGAGIGLVILGVPLAIPLAALVFLGAFVPIIGGVVAGGIAVLIALVANGPIPALVLLGIVIGVQQLEAHVLQPLLLGRAVNLHPLAVVLAIAVGLVAAGIPGALLAVPLLAVLNSGIRSLCSEADEHTDPADVHASHPEASAPNEPGLEVVARPRMRAPPSSSAADRSSECECLGLSPARRGLPAIGEHVPVVYLPGSPQTAIMTGAMRTFNDLAGRFALGLAAIGSGLVVILAAPE